jgi:hypothetical protein
MLEQIVQCAAEEERRLLQSNVMADSTVASRQVSATLPCRGSGRRAAALLGRPGYIGFSGTVLLWRKQFVQQSTWHGVWVIANVSASQEIKSRRCPAPVRNLGQVLHRRSVPRPGRINPLPFWRFGTDAPNQSALPVHRWLSRLHSLPPVASSCKK